jgi:3-oxoadipate enol-lactonase
MTDRFVPVPGGRLYVEVDGDPTRPPVVLVHAGIANLRAWDAMVPLLVAGDYRIVRYDMRSFGRSTTNEVDYSDRDDALAVLDALGIGRAPFVGNSRGGMVSIDTAIEYPDRVVAVVGVGAGIGGFDGELTPVEIELVDEMEALESAVPMDAAAIADVDIRLWVDGPGQPPTRVPAVIREAIRAWDTPYYLPDHVDPRPIRLDPPAVERLAELRCPALAVAGALDLSEVAQAAHLLAAKAPDARAVILPDVAHMIGMEVPDTLAELIIDFLAPLPRWS